MVNSVEPQHGARQLTGPLRPVLRNAASRLFAFLPDGRIWAAMNYQSKIVGQERSWDQVEQRVVTADVQVWVPSGGTSSRANWVEMAAIGNIGRRDRFEVRWTLWDIFPRSLNDIVEPVTNNWSVGFHNTG